MLKAFQLFDTDNAGTISFEKLKVFRSSDMHAFVCACVWMGGCVHVFACLFVCVCVFYCCSFQRVCVHARGHPTRV